MIAVSSGVVTTLIGLGLFAVFLFACVIIRACSDLLDQARAESEHVCDEMTE